MLIVFLTNRKDYYKQFHKSEKCFFYTDNGVFN
jgi:hypothetical protein